MIAIDKIVAAAVSVLCMTCASCTQKDEIIKEYAPSWWRGEYAVQIENAATGTLEDHTALMELDFLEDGKEGWVITGIPGVSEFVRSEYEVRWSSGNQFAFYSSTGGQSLLCYSGTISGSEMTLKVLNCDSVAATYKLSRWYLRKCV